MPNGVWRFSESPRFSLKCPRLAREALEIKRKRANFRELAAEDLMTKEELRAKLDNLELAREAAERELRLAREHSERLSSGTPKTSWRPMRRGVSRPWKSSPPKSGGRCTGYLTSPSRPTPTGG